MMNSEERIMDYDQYYGMLDGIPEQVIYEYVNAKYEGFYQKQAIEMERRLDGLKNALLDDWPWLKKFHIKTMEDYLRNY